MSRPFNFDGAIDSTYLTREYNRLASVIIHYLLVVPTRCDWTHRLCPKASSTYPGRVQQRPRRLASASLPLTQSV